MSGSGARLSEPGQCGPGLPRFVQRLLTLLRPLPRQCAGWLVLAVCVPLLIFLLCQLVFTAVALLVLLLLALCLARFWLPEESRLVESLVREARQALQRNKTGDATRDKARDKTRDKAGDSTASTPPAPADCQGPSPSGQAAASLDNRQKAHAASEATENRASRDTG